MKVLLVNGSPRKNGCVHTGLSIVAEALNQEGIDTEIYWIGNQPVSGCTACRSCVKTGRCVIDDQVNTFRQKAYEADGFVFGSPVHYASASGNLTGFMDRLFFSERHGNASRAFRLKPAAAVVSARRSGTTATLDQLNRYFTMYEMPVISSRYWNAVHGSTPEEVRKDEEGTYVMRTLGCYMAYFLRCQEAGRQAGIVPPDMGKTYRTDFIRE